MEKEPKTVEYYTTNSDTSFCIADMYPKGSSPTKEEIMDWYEKLSSSQRQDKSSHSKNGIKVPSRKSVRATRRTSGKKLYKKLVNIGYWKIR